MHYALISAISRVQSFLGAMKKIFKFWGSDYVVRCDSEDAARLFFDVGKKCVSSYFSIAHTLFCTLYLKLQVLDKLVWEIICRENAITCVSVFERVLTVELVYIYYVIAQWYDATRTAVKNEKKREVSSMQR